MTGQWSIVQHPDHEDITDLVFDYRSGVRLSIRVHILTRIWNMPRRPAPIAGGDRSDRGVARSLWHPASRRVTIRA